jgi:acyl-coenzyme A thioesterase PaaI-like protein
MTQPKPPHEIPAGFRPVAIGGEYLRTVGPLWGRWDGRHVRLGFRVEERHANMARACHGGMLATFADMQMAVVTHYQWPDIAGHSFPTISMTTDFVAMVDEATVLRFSGIYKIGPKRDYANPRDPFGLMSTPATGRK